MLRSRSVACVEASSTATMRKACVHRSSSVRRRVAGGKTSFVGTRVGAPGVSNGSMARMARWLENRAEIEVPVPLEVAWVLWDDRERIPQWMPWIKSVKMVPEDPRLSRWTLSTNQFGRDWEFSWLARNLAPVKNQKIHWASEPGSASFGINVNNRGQIRFARRGAGACHVSLTISYEVPDVLAPFASALTPVVEGIIGRDMVRFKDYAQEYARAAGAGQGAEAGAPPQPQPQQQQQQQQ